MLMFLQLAKHDTFVRLLCFSPSSLFACAASNRANLAFKTTIIEDTHLTLAVILFKVKANNSLIFLLLQTCEKKFAEFPFLFIFTTPCFKSGISRSYAPLYKTTKLIRQLPYYYLQTV